MGGTSNHFCSIVCLAAMFIVGGAASRAADIGYLYQAKAFVTGQTEANRGEGFAQCFTDVLVKVSGDPRLIGDRRVALLAGNAGALVSEFRYRDLMGHLPIHDEQGTRDRPYELTVKFDPAKIDAALQSLGRKPWSTPRPRVVVFLGVLRDTETFVLDSDGDRGPGMREALSDAAERVGMPMLLPDRATLAKGGFNFEKSQAIDVGTLDTTVKEIGGGVPLMGSLVWKQGDLGWTADWRLGAQDKVHHWRIRSVNFDDAFRGAMRGAAQILSRHGWPN